MLLILGFAFVSLSVGAVPATAGETKAATVAAAAAAFDLGAIPLLPHEEPPGERTTTGLAYQGIGGVEAGFDFHRDQLVAAGWKELPGTSRTAQFASGTFAKEGLHLSLSVMPEGGNRVNVMMRHHGNVAAGAVPLPPGATPVYAGPLTAIHTLNEPLEAARERVTAGLVAAGWEPYGEAGPMRWFRQNAVRLTVMTSAAPGPAGRTTINVTTEMLPAEIPAPPTATTVQFQPSLKRLTFDAPMDAAGCIAFYRDALAAHGWSSRMEAPVRDEAGSIYAFRNAAGDMMKLTMKPAGGTLKVAVDLQTAAEIAEMNRKLDAQAEAYRKRNLPEETTP